MTAEALTSPSEVPAPDATPEPATTAEEQNQELVTTPEPAPVDNRLYIDPARGHYQELTRLEQEDEAVRNAIRTRVGRVAAREYKPKIAELEHERNQLRSELQRLKNESIDVEELKVKLLDPEFRRQYDAANAQNTGPDPRTVAWFEASFTEAVEEAEKHLPPEILGRYTTALTQQWYDYERDAQGRPGRALTPEESMRRFQFDLNRASIQYVKQAATVPPPPPPPPPKAEAPQPVSTIPEPAPAQAKVNPALAQSSPDLTPNSVQRAAGTMSLSDYNSKTPPEKIRLFPEGLQAAIDSGKVFVD